MEGPTRRDRFVVEYRRFQDVAGWSTLVLFSTMPVMVLLTLLVSPFLIWGFLGLVALYSVAYWRGQRKWSRIKHGFWVDVNALSILRMALLALVGAAVGLPGTLALVFWLSPEPSPEAAWMVALAIGMFAFEFPAVFLANRYRQRRFRNVQVRFIRAPRQAVIAALGAALDASGAQHMFEEKVKIGFFVGPGFLVLDGSLRILAVGARPKETSVYRTSPSPAADTRAAERAIDAALERLDGALE